jgi:glycosyltransferase involved in cell wall biosynthesis
VTPAKIVAATMMREHGETGVQTHINTVTEYLVSVGIPTEVVTPFSYLRPVATPVYAVRAAIDRLDGELSVWWYRYWHYLFLLGALRRRLPGEADDAVICTHCPVSALAALRARKSPCQRVFMVMHYDISQAEEWAIMGKISRTGGQYQSILRLESAVLPRLDGIVYVSEFMRDHTHRTIPATRAVPYIVMPNFLPSAPPPRGDEMGGDLISIGTLEPRKNQAYLLRVLAEAKRRGHEYSLTLVGDGQDRRGLGELAQSLGIARQVRFLGFQPKAARLLPGHRAYVHGALLESSPIALIEALSHGLPVFAGHVGGIPEMITEGVDGCFWPLDDPAGGARRVVELLEDPERYAELAAGATATFERRFHRGVLADRLVRFLTGRSDEPTARRGTSGPQEARLAGAS